MSQLIEQLVSSVCQLLSPINNGGCCPDDGIGDGVGYTDDLMMTVHVLDQSFVKRVF